MGIAIAIQDAHHTQVELITGYDSDALVDMISSAPSGSLIDCIHLYADTMYNSHQLKFLLDELSNSNYELDHEKEVTSILRRAAESAIRQRGYLWFSGD
ncbi:hypothetical protein ACFXPR_24185 [Nocardia tengchongensis]|uniref:hypothetical protein n=1 Tax=Nocardia tengchongensis TaxID=2055889 RepID=UPI003692F515